MANPEIALAASARDWSDRLHRFLLDHGGATVTGRMMSADQANRMSFDVLFIDDICSYLSPRLVIDVRDAGRSIVGVFSPDDGADGKRRLLEVGISDVVEADAQPEELLAIARASISTKPPLAETSTPPPTSGIVIGVIGPPGGVGVTEVAVGVSREIARRHQMVLLDLNQSWPSIGQRLALPVHPNLRTAVDLALHEPERLAAAVHELEGMGVVSGLANPRSGKLPATDILALVTAVAAIFHSVVVDLGTVDELSDLILRPVDALLVVGSGDPVGITRLVRTCEYLTETGLDLEFGVVVNRFGGGGRQRDEVKTQLAHLLPGYPVMIVSEDRRLARAGWDGTLVDKGSFHRQMRRLAGLFDEARHDG